MYIAFIKFLVDVEFLVLPVQTIHCEKWTLSAVSWLTIKLISHLFSMILLACGYF